MIFTPLVLMIGPLVFIYLWRKELQAEVQNKLTVVCGACGLTSPKKYCRWTGTEYLCELCEEKSDDS